MLRSMLQIITNAHSDQAPFDRSCVLHPLRVMAALKSTDEELNCIALGHELLNKTDVSIRDLVVAGMSDRVIRGIILFKDAATPEQTLDNICETIDTMKVGLVCLLDRSAVADPTSLTDDEKKTIRGYHLGYIRIAKELNDMEKERGNAWSLSGLANRLRRN